MPTQTKLALAVHGAVAGGLIIAATVLLALHDLDSSTAVALYGVAVALVGGSTAGLAAGSNTAADTTVIGREHLATLTAAALSAGQPAGAPATATAPPRPA